MSYMERNPAFHRCFFQDNYRGRKIRLQEADWFAVRNERCGQYDRIAESAEGIRHDISQALSVYHYLETAFIKNSRLEKSNR